MMKKKRIVHVISSLKMGGAEMLLVDLIAGLGNENYEHHVVYFHDGPIRTRLFEHGIMTHQITGRLGRYDPFFLVRLAKLLRALKPDLIHAALWAANFLGRIIGKMLSIPVVCVVHLGMDQDGTVRNVLDRPTLGLASHIVAVSHGVANSITERMPRMAGRMTVIRNGLNASQIVARGQGQATLRKDLGLQPEHIVIGSVGRFIPRKNYGLLLRSFAALHEKYPLTRLVLVGTGPDEALLRAQAEGLGIANEVTFVVGKLAYGYYPLFDIFALTSHAEGLSIALLEAMSFSLPCMVIAERGHEVLVSDSNGVVVPCYDELELTKAFERLVTNESLRSKLGSAARKTLEKDFNLDVMIDSYRGIFDHVAAR